MNSNNDQEPRPGSNTGLQRRKQVAALNIKKEEDPHASQLFKVGQESQMEGQKILDKILPQKTGSRRHLPNNAGGIPVGDSSITSNMSESSNINYLQDSITKSMNKMTLGETEDALKSANSKMLQKTGSYSMKSPIKIGQNSSTQDVPDNFGTGWETGADDKDNQQDYDDKNIKPEDLKVIGELGSGSQGHVQKVLNTKTNKLIALKVLDIHTDSNFLNALKIELSTLVNCNSDNVVRCYGAFQKGGSIQIALEYMDKGSLADLLKKVKSLSEPIIGMITYQVLKGLEHLHKNMKVIHRDIKPSNLLINSDGFVKIADFGVSGKIEFTLQYRETWVGTLPYMSPERCRGEKYNFDTDLWSLGLCILECALGKYPYADQSDTSKMTFFDMVDILSNKPTPKLPEGYSPAMVDFVSICMRKEAGTRTTATELLKHNFVKKFALVNKSTFKAWIETV